MGKNYGNGNGVCRSLGAYQQNPFYATDLKNVK